VIATSSAACAVSVRRGLSHTRLAMVLATAATLGALAGGITAVLLSPDLLEGLFAAVLVYMSYRTGQAYAAAPAAAPTGLLDTSYTDPVSAQTVIYGVRSLPIGMAASFLAGSASGLLGIGGGSMKVPVMRLVMGMPLRAAIATSNYVLGVAAATSAVIYYQRGFLDPTCVIPTTLGVLAGAQLGTRIGGKVRSQRSKLLLQGLLLVLAMQMIYRGVAR
jgi:uncharacterized protein